MTGARPCPVCQGNRVVATGSYLMTPTFRGFIPDGGSKQCPGCDGTGVSIKDQKAMEQTK